MARWVRRLTVYRHAKIAVEAAWWTYRLVDALYRSPDTDAEWRKRNPPPKGSTRDRFEQRLGQILPLLVAGSVGISVFYNLTLIGAWKTSKYLEIFRVVGDWMVWQLHLWL